MMLLAIALGIPGHGLGQTIKAGGMSFSWVVEGPHLVGTLRAPTTGWITVGFNDAPRLAGARLIMTRLRNGRVDIEEHLAAPPTHRRIAPARVETLGGARRAGNTQITFWIPLDALPTAPGQITHFVLAYSRSADFFHHSVMRTAVNARL